MHTAHVRVSDLVFHWPDGTAVLDGISFDLGPGRLGLLAANGGGKSTLLRLLAGELSPRSGHIHINGKSAYLPQHLNAHIDATVAGLLGVEEHLQALGAIRAGNTDAELFELLDGHWDLEERIQAQLDRIGLPGLPLHRPLTSLSGGELVLLALGAQLLRNLDVLLLDEPTNHLDRDGRRRVHALLSEWRGCLLVASHDRDLLAHMDHIAELEISRLRIYGGNFSRYREQRQIEREAAEKQLRHLQGEMAREKRDQQKARERAERRHNNAARKLSNAGLPKIIAGKRKQAAQQSAGKADAVHASRLTDIQGRLRHSMLALEQIEPIDFSFPALHLPEQRVLFSGERLRVRPGERQLFPPDGISLLIRGPERIALVGGNGVGKTSLLKLLSGELAPSSGCVSFRSDRMACLPQNLALPDPAGTVAEHFARHAPHLSLTDRANALARLQFRAERVNLPLAALSGGEQLRIALTCLLHADPPPQLLLLDEPTNHLDLDSVAVLEQALRAYRGAIVVVSHDDRFLSAIRPSRWLELTGTGLREFAPEFDPAL